VHAEELWSAEIRREHPNCPFILVGIKDDKAPPSSRYFKKEELGENLLLGQQIAETVGAVKYVECNIVTHEGLEDVFKEVRGLAATARHVTHGTISSTSAYDRKGYLGGPRVVKPGTKKLQTFLESRTWTMEIFKGPNDRRRQSRR
jgi:hypothetical protein